MLIAMERDPTSSDISLSAAHQRLLAMFPTHQNVGITPGLVSPSFIHLHLACLLVLSRCSGRPMAPQEHDDINSIYFVHREFLYIIGRDSIC